MHNDKDNPEEYEYEEANTQEYSDYADYDYGYWDGYEYDDYGPEAEYEEIQLQHEYDVKLQQALDEISEIKKTVLYSERIPETTILPPVDASNAVLPPAPFQPAQGVIMPFSEFAITDSHHRAFTKQSELFQYTQIASLREELQKVKTQAQISREISYLKDHAKLQAAIDNSKMTQAVEKLERRLANYEKRRK